MSHERKSCVQSGLQRLWICFTFMQILSASALPQNYFEQAAAGALDVANRIAEIFQNGAAVRKDMGFQLPGMSMRSKTEVGMGEAVIHRSYSRGEEDSNEYRRKRAIDSSEDFAAGGPRTSFSKLMRNINAPCHGGSGGGTGGTGGTGAGDGGDDIVDEARRRMARMRARKAAASKKKSTTTKKKSGRRRRRRRQTELDDLEDLSESKRAEYGNDFRAHMQEFTEKMSRVYEHISASVMEMMQRMQEHFYDNANGES